MPADISTGGADVIARPACIVCQFISADIRRGLVLVGVLGSPALDERGLNGGPVAGAGGVLAQSINDGSAPIVNGRSPVERPGHGVVAVGNVVTFNLYN